MKITSVLLTLLLLTACVTEQEARRLSSPQSAGIDWEPRPRVLASGTGAQLWIRASEAVSMLFAGAGNGGGQDLFFARSDDQGDSFSRPVRVNADEGELQAHGENDPQMRSGKNVYVLWEGGRDIKLSRSMNFGKTFSTPIRINDNELEKKSSRSFSTMEVAPDGTVYAAWLDGRDGEANIPGTSSLYLARSTDGGATFGKNKLVAGNICPCCRPSLAFGEGGVMYAAWRRVYADNERVVEVASSRDGGESWSEPVRVTPRGWKINGCPHSGPVLGHVGGSLVVVWYSAEDGQAALKAARSADGGRTFEVFQNIAGRVLDATHPHLQIVGEKAWVIFQGRDPDSAGGWGANAAWLVRIPPAGGISFPEPLPNEGKGVFYPKLFAGTGGRVYAVWTEAGKEGPRLMLCRGRIRS